jgi:DNA topoisomerase-1
MLTQLIHNGVAVPEPAAPRGLVLEIRGRPAALTPKQEEMILAWARKLGTPYVEDPVFARNFLADLSREMGVEPALELAEIDLSPAARIVRAEQAARARLAPEERKALAAERKVQREALRERYGYAQVNGERVELANYVVEPSGIFMGRGEHPLRGRWKEGARRPDITLNLSPDAPCPPGEWAEVVWQPESLWVARWPDKLSGKIKYVWLSDTAAVKQAREARKFDKAHVLHAELGRVRAQITTDLLDGDARRRMVATACTLIDALGLRVGDEKDEDEADTVGATTLRVEHVKLHSDGVAEFKFLGKDSVLWHKKLALPEAAQRNLVELIAAAVARSAHSAALRDDKTSHSGGRRANGARRANGDKKQIFPGITSHSVNAYLSDIVPGLTAKVFRTHHATMAVRDSLAGSGVEADDPEYEKWEAANLANLAAAVLCNHTKKEPAGWSASRQRFKERQQSAEKRVDKYRTEVKQADEALDALRQEARGLREAAPDQWKKVQARAQKKIEQARRRLETAKGQLHKAQLSLGKIKAQAGIAAKRRTWNLGTSLKSYIDPRVYHEWGQQVGYDVLESYYPTALRRKFAWVRGEAQDTGGVTPSSAAEGDDDEL